MKLAVSTHLLPAPLLLLAILGVPTYASPLYNVNFLDTQGADSAVYTGDQNNWFNPSCGSTSSNGGYAYCGASLYGDLLTNTRAYVTTPNMPFSTSLGFQFDILNAQSAIIGIVSIGPSGGCNGPGGATVTCGVSVGIINSPNGGALSSSAVSLFSNIPVAGSAVATGANQTAFALDWSNGRVDDLNFQIASTQTTPEPAMLGLVGVALLGLGLYRRGRS